MAKVVAGAAAAKAAMSSAKSAMEDGLASLKCMKQMADEVLGLKKFEETMKEVARHAEAMKDWLDGEDKQAVQKFAAARNAAANAMAASGKVILQIRSLTTTLQSILETGDVEAVKGALVFWLTNEPDLKKDLHEVEKQLTLAENLLSDHGLGIDALVRACDRCVIKMNADIKSKQSDKRLGHLWWLAGPVAGIIGSIMTEVQVAQIGDAFQQIIKMVKDSKSAFEEMTKLTKQIQDKVIQQRGVHQTVAVKFQASSNLIKCYKNNNYEKGAFDWLPVIKKTLKDLEEACARSPSSGGY